MLAMIHSQLPPTPNDIELARTSSQSIAPYANSKKSLHVSVIEAGREQPIELPAGAVVLLMDILKAMAAGQGIQIIPVSAELTTIQAAELLNVSRPFLIKLLEAGNIPYRTVGKHRRIRMEDLMAYKQRNDAEREKILDELAAQAQEYNMGYEKP